MKRWLRLPIFTKLSRDSSVEIEKRKKTNEKITVSLCLSISHPTSQRRTKRQQQLGWPSSALPSSLVLRLLSRRLSQEKKKTNRNLTILSDSRMTSLCISRTRYSHHSSMELVSHLSRSILFHNSNKQQTR